MGQAVTALLRAAHSSGHVHQVALHRSASQWTPTLAAEGLCYKLTNAQVWPDWETAAILMWGRCPAQGGLCAGHPAWSTRSWTLWPGATAFGADASKPRPPRSPKLWLWRASSAANQHPLTGRGPAGLVESVGRGRGRWATGILANHQRPCFGHSPPPCRQPSSGAEPGSGECPRTSSQRRPLFSVQISCCL